MTIAAHIARLAAASMSAAGLLMAGCTEARPWVKPYELEHLVDPIMSLTPDPVSSDYLTRIHEHGESARGATGTVGVLPDDRADLLVHVYEGGGITMQGPSLLARKKFMNTVSLAASYDTESISDASIDLLTPTSPASERRNRYGLSADVAHGKDTYSAGYLSSTESDYRSRTAFLSVSEDMFGDLTTLRLTATRGWDEARMLGNTAFRQPIDRRNWAVGLTQVLTPNLRGRMDLEASESEGFLNNPYRQVRYRDALSASGYSKQLERYPHTRTGNAAALELKYYLPWRAAVDGNYRYYKDSWGVRANTFRLGYTHPWRNWTFEGHGRYYSQNHADFYGDLFPGLNAQNFLARDRELAAFHSNTFGATASRQFMIPRATWMTKGTLNASYDRMHFSYSDYRDLRVQVRTPGTEPLYAFDADVMQLFVSIWF